MHYTQDISGCVSPLGPRTNLLETDFGDTLSNTSRSLAFIKDSYENATLPLFRLPEARDDLAVLEEIAQRYRESFKDVIILGTGGSSLGGRCLYAIVNEISLQCVEAPKLHFMDNVDPILCLLFASLCPITTGLIVFKVRRYR